MRRYFTIGFLVSVGILALIGITVLLIPKIRFSDEVLQSCLLAAGFNLLAALLSLFINRGRLSIVAWLGLSTATIASICTLIMIWVPWPTLGREGGDAIARTAGFTATLACWSAGAGLILIIRLYSNWTKWIRRGVITTLTIPAVIILWATVDERSLEYIVDHTIGEDLAARLIGVDSILFAAGLTTILVMALIERRARHDAQESLDRRLHVSLTCPRCKSDQNLPTGHRKCTSCGLDIRIEADEPRCRCGYLLHELRGDTCPECGKEIPQADRWPWKTPPNAATPKE